MNERFLQAIQDGVNRLLAEAAGVTGRSERRWLWDYAKDGYLHLSELPATDRSAAGYKRRYRLIRKLEDAHLVQLMNGNDGTRAVAIRLTPEGREALR